jgi:hypothetical protein
MVVKTQAKLPMAAFWAMGLRLPAMASFPDHPTGRNDEFGQRLIWSKIRSESLNPCVRSGRGLYNPNP